MKTNSNRLQFLNSNSYKQGNIAYWMYKDIRVLNNWSLIWTQEKSLSLKQPHVVFFTLDTSQVKTWRYYSFLISGLKEVESRLNYKNIPFYLLLGNPKDNIFKFISQYNIGYLVTDFSPLLEQRQIIKSITPELHIPLVQVDSSNVVPVWETSNKQEYAARTIRPKIHKKLPEFLDSFPYIKTQNLSWPYKIPSIDWEKLKTKVELDESVAPVDSFKGGEEEAKKTLREFIDTKLSLYSDYKNIPHREVVSNLSPYLAQGHISSQYIALKVRNSNHNKADIDSFLEELIVRRELAQNFCYYNNHYSSIKGVPNWGRETLQAHAKDIREYTYTLSELEQAQTHDQAWNAAQVEMKSIGKMHGYMRMYWAKKILEWSKNYTQAFNNALYLNNKYELDAYDANSYVGIAWSIGGLHDHPWKERDIFGKVRYMNYNGLKRKFNIEKYINTYL